jgi:enoyl-CoA hydratase
MIARPLGQWETNMARVTMTVTERVAEITLDHPPVNALDVAYLNELIAALRQASADEGVGALLIMSALPGRFCAGIDLNGVRTGDTMAVHQLLEKLYIELADVQYNLGKPSIAVVEGAARGGGMTLGISCNMIVAGQSATFGYPEIEVGLIPAIHFIHLPRIIGRHRAFELLFSGRAFPASEALALGLVTRVVEDGAVRHAARTMARQYAARSALVTRLAHQAFMRFNDYRVEIGHTTEAFCTVAGTADARAAIGVFLDRGKGGKSDGG